jgi:hypothetical protein
MAWLPQFLNASLAFLVLTLGVLLLDFVLSPNLKKTIDDRIETISLRLSYVVTIDWLRRWLHATRRAEIVDIVCGILELVTFLFFATVISIGLFANHPFLAVPAGLILGVLATLASWRPVRTILEHVGKPLMRELAECDSLFEFTLKYFTGMSITFFLLACGLGLALWVGDTFGVTIARLFVFWFGGALTVWFLFFLDGLLTYIGAAIVLVLRIIIAMARFTIWRIAIFPKGPTTAIVTLLSAAIVLAKFIMHK